MPATKNQSNLYLDIIGRTPHHFTRRMNHINIRARKQTSLLMKLFEKNLREMYQSERNKMRKP